LDIQKNLELDADDADGAGDDVVSSSPAAAAASAAPANTIVLSAVVQYES
jgi:hypothetical protein